MARPHFDWQDPFQYSQLLTEEEQLIREIMNELGELGLLGATLPALLS